jgi:hypothetical protein
MTCGAVDDIWDGCSGSTSCISWPVELLSNRIMIDLVLFVLGYYSMHQSTFSSLLLVRCIRQKPL